MYERITYSQILKKAALLFSFCCIAGQLQAMESEKDEGWWGGRIKAPGSASVLSQGDMLTFSLPDTTGLSGWLTNDAVSIVDVPKGKEKDI